MAALYGALAGLAFGVLAVSIRWALRRGADPEVGALAATLVALAVSAVIAAPQAADGFEAGRLWPFLLGGALAPGASQILLTQAVRHAGPARASILIGTAPLMSVLIALTLLSEPARAVLLIGTVLVVAGGFALAHEQARPQDWRRLGAVLALACAVLFAARDNVFRWAARGTHPPPLVAATASLVAATTVVLAYLLARRRRDFAQLLGRTLPPFAAAGAALGLGYDLLALAFDRGRVSIVAPLNATQSLWAVVLASVLFGRSEAIGRRVVLAAVLVVAGGALIGFFR